MSIQCESFSKCLKDYLFFKVLGYIDGLKGSEKYTLNSKVIQEFDKEFFSGTGVEKTYLEPARTLGLPEDFIKSNENYFFNLATLEIRKVLHILRFLNDDLIEEIINYSGPGRIKKFSEFWDKLRKEI